MCRRPKAKLWIAKLDRLSRNAMHLAFVLLDSKKSATMPASLRFI